MNIQEQTKRIAVLVPGGVGARHSGKYLPAPVNILDGLGAMFEVVVYSLTGVGDLEAAAADRHFTVRTRGGEPGDSVMKRALLLSGLLLKDHCRQRFDLLHGFWAAPSGSLAVILGKILGLPAIVSLRGGEAACLPEIGYGSMRLPRLKKITLWTCRHAASVTALTRFQRTAVQSFGLDRKIQVIPTGVDPSLFQYHEKEIGEPLHLLHVANLTEVKDQVTLLRAFALVRRHRDCRLRIVGPDYLDGRIQKLSETLGLADAVTFTGYVPNSELGVHYRWAHLMLHTSLYEGQGNVIAEAAASGVVVVGTEVGLIADLAPDAARAVPVGDAHALARGVLELVENLRLYDSLRERALVWARDHDLTWTVSCFGELYREVLA